MLYPTMILYEKISLGIFHWGDILRPSGQNFWYKESTDSCTSNFVALYHKIRNFDTESVIPKRT